MPSGDLVDGSCLQLTARRSAGEREREMIVEMVGDERRERERGVDVKGLCWALTITVSCQTWGSQSNLIPRFARRESVYVAG